MSDLKIYLEHYRKKLDRNQHDKNVCMSAISKLSTVVVTKELLEETGVWKPLRSLSRKGDDVGKNALCLYKKWRKLFEDSPKKETAFQPPKLVASSNDLNRSHGDHIPKPHHDSPSKSSKHQHLSTSKSNSKLHISSPKSDIKHKISLSNSNVKRNLTSPSCPSSLATKTSSPKKDVKAILSLDALISGNQKDRQFSSQNLHTEHSLVKLPQDLKHSHKSVNQERKIAKPIHESQPPDFIVKKHVSSSHDKNKSVPSHNNPELASSECNPSLNCKTSDKHPAHFKADSNDLVKSAHDQRSNKSFSHSESKNVSLLDSPVGRQKAKSSCQKSETSFTSDASNAFLTISNCEKSDSTDQLNFEEDANLVLGSSPAKKLVVEPYAIDMREGMFRVVKTSDSVPKNIMRLQEIYDRDLMEESSRKVLPKSNDERNGKKHASVSGQSKGGKMKGTESPSPSKNKRPSSGTKEVSAKHKISPSFLASQPPLGSATVEKLHFANVNKSKVPSEENICMFKESKKPLKKGESSCSPQSQKIRKISHIQ